MVCEALRKEENQKTTLLGVYGPLGAVQIRVKELGKAIEKITFVFYFANNSEIGSLTVDIQILLPDGENFIPSFPVPMEIAKVNQRHTIVFGVNVPVFAQVGHHYVKMSVNGDEFFSESFEILHDPNL